MRFLIILALAAAAARAQGPSSAVAVTPARPGPEEDLTVITSEKLTFEYQKHYAVFEQNVVVTDPELKLLSDKLTVFFDATNRAQTIKAEGQVYIVQEDKRAKSKLATYDVPTGKIVLEGDPQVTSNDGTLSGRVITFWRDENRVLVEGGSTLVIKSTEGDKKGGLPMPRTKP
jgi:lipopolysaccharide export system protein LptA